MASAKLLLPPSAALFQSSPVPSTAFFCDRHRYLPPSAPARPFQLFVLHTHVNDPSVPVRLSSDGEEALSFGDELTDNENGDDNGEDEGEKQLVNKNPPARGSSSQAEAATTTGSSSRELEGTLSKYVWSQPRKEGLQLSRKDRLDLVESIVFTDSNLLMALDKARFKLSPSDFGNLLQRLIQEKKWEKVGLTFDWMKVNKKLKPKSLSVFITQMGKAGFHYKALRAYRSLTDLDMKLDKYVCNALLKSLVDAGSLEKAFTLFEELKSNGFLPDSYSYSTVIGGCAKRQNAYAKARGYMTDMYSKGLKPDSFVYSSMLNVCARSGLEDEAKALFVEMQNNGVKPETYHYAPLLNMYAEKKKPEEAERVFDEFQKTGLPLNEVILNSLIKAYLSCGQLEKASFLFTEMPSLCGPPGEVTYSLMMDAYSKVGRVEKAHSLFEEMKEKGVTPGNYMYSILISAYAKLGKADMVVSLTKDLENRKQGIADPVLFNSVLKSFCELGMMDAVMNTLKRMNQERVSPDRATFNILICFFCKQRMFDIALHTLNDLKVRKLRPNMNSYAPLIIELANMGKVDQALEVYPELKENGIRPPASIVCPLVDALCKEKRLNEAVKYFKELLETLTLENSSQDLGSFPLPSCTQSLLILAGTDLVILEDILGYDFMPSAALEQVDLATVLSEYERQGSYAAMHKLLDYMEKEKVNVGTHDRWDELIRDLKQDGQTEILAKLSAQMSQMQLNAISSAS